MNRRDLRVGDCVVITNPAHPHYGSSGYIEEWPVVLDPKDGTAPPQWTKAKTVAIVRRQWGGEHPIDINLPDQCGVEPHDIQRLGDHVTDPTHEDMVHYEHEGIVLSLPNLFALGRKRMTDPTPIDTPYGTLYVDPEELVIGRLLQADGKIPDISEEVAFFRKHLKPGDTAIDVGANYGLFTLALADIVGGAGHVYALEPNGAILPYLDRTTCPLNCVVVPFAAGRSLATGLVHLDPRGSGGTQILEVKQAALMGITSGDGTYVLALDEAVTHDRPIKAIKIDAEGMDVDVLLGAEKILKEDRPAVIFEWNPEAMQSLGKDPFDEFGVLLDLSFRVDYSITNLGGSQDERMLGNMCFLPDELLES